MTKTPSPSKILKPTNQEQNSRSETSPSNHSQQIKLKALDCSLKGRARNERDITADTNAKPSPEKDFGNTDSYLSDNWILKMFSGFDDPCPYNDNPEEDGLKKEWKDKTYVNPPYSNPLPWVEKAIEESKKGKMIVMLLKMDTSTKWFARLKESKAHFLWINGRLRYNKKSYTHFDNTPLPFPSMLVVLYG